MENVPSPAEELVILDRELSQLDARRTQLLVRRTWLLAALRPVAPGGPVAPPAGRPFAAPAAAEASPPGVQNLLLTLGGLLLAIAAIAFTLVSWGEMGIGGRAAVLGVLTVAALGTPVVLLRRGLLATAESVAVLGLVLTVLDAYALHRTVLAGTDGVGYSAFASAALAALWSVYGLLLPRLLSPLPVAVAAAQLPLPLWALTADAAAPPMEWALLSTAALDVAVVLWTRPVGVRAVAWTTAAATGGGALLIGTVRSLAADGAAAAAGPAALLVAAAAVSLFTAWRAPAAGWVSVVSGLAVVAGIGGVIRAVVPDGWAVPGYLLCAVAVLGVGRAVVPMRLLPGLAGAAGAVHVAAVATTLPVTVAALTGPATTLTAIWSGPSSLPDVDAATTALLPTPLVLLITATVLVSAARHRATAATPAAASGTPGPGPAPSAPVSSPAPHTAGGADPAADRPAAGSQDGAAADADAPPGAPGPGAASSGGVGPDAPAWTWPPSVAGVRSSGAPGARQKRAAGLRNAARCGALVAAWAALVVLPTVFGFAYSAAVAWQLALTVAVLALGVRRSGGTATTALVCALGGSVSLSLLSLATRPATFAAFGALVAALALAALRTRGPVQALLACTATLYAAAFAGATAAAWELPQHRAALLLLVVPALTALLGAVLRRRPAALPVEVTGAAAGLVAVPLAAGHAPTSALVLALGGVIAAGTAVRTERRPVAGHLAAVLFVAATWVRLAASDVTSPEAYTLPVTAAALAVGALRRRRDPQASSWTAYGPGLAATLLPSLVAAWGDEHWLRPLLLGLAALAVTLAGARLRLQALLVLGGAVLALDALHELAPYVVQVVGALPRWLPPAFAGLLLLAVGATYEQRLRDARRLRDRLNRMR
ncbi:SCO7613 C-terminal domain-containing membrane protein [Streptomyces xantholiticus]|uniref:Integral membrane protein n=1 Tax=Streptomyces xantholiticus TaxID=68285 RepID=A0ABV1UQE6_9ACTN